MAQKDRCPVKRFHLSADAERGLLEIGLYLDSLPRVPAGRITDELQAKLYDIADNFYIGQPHSDLTRIAGQEVRSRLCGVYRIYYRMRQQVPEIFAIRHTSRDSRGVLANRLQ